jgi:pyrimidine operon attenuation protein/uracil phosphoribosyltransferase
VHSGGAWIARRLRDELAPGAPLGFRSSAFHRDDFAQRGLRGGGDQRTSIGFPVDGADVLLVDDILYTGRTVRAALNEIFDYGRPRRVELVILGPLGQIVIRGLHPPGQSRSRGASHGSGRRSGIHYRLVGRRPRLATA